MKVQIADVLKHKKKEHKQRQKSVSLNMDDHGHAKYVSPDIEKKQKVPLVKALPEFISSDFSFDSSFHTADGPIDPSQEKEIPAHILPSLIYGSLSDEQKEIITQFRADPEIAEWISPPRQDHHLHTDFYLTRFLVAREWDFLKAKDMFITAMKWRKENKVDSIIQDFEKEAYFPLLSSYWPGSFHRDWDFWSFDNSFVSYQRLGTLDVGLMDIVPQEVLIRYHIYCAEILEMKYAKIVRLKGYCPGCIMVEDLSNLGMSFVDKKIMELLKLVVKIDSDYYPAILRKFFIINTPRVFTMVWAVVKKFFDQATLEKFEILGSEPKKVIPILKEIIPEKYLLDFYEGESSFRIPSGGSVKELVDFTKSLPKKEEK